MDFFRTFIGKSAKRRIGEVLDKGWLNEGEQVRKFEKRISKLLDLPNILTTNSCSSSLLLCLLDIDVAGHEVLLPPQTFIATGMAVLAAGGKPVFVDIDPSTGNINPDKIAQAVTAKTKAIIPVHWSGNPCDMLAINNIANEFGLKVVQDAAHALGATLGGRSIAHCSDYTCFSFQSIKHLTTGDGGAICTPEPNQKLKQMKWFGIDKTNIKKDSLGGRLPDVDMFGFKWHMNDVAGALGVANLTGFRRRLEERRRVARLYHSVSNGMKVLPDAEPAYWMFTMRTTKRDALCQRLKENNLPFSTVDYGIHRNPIFRVSNPEFFQGQNEFDATQVSLPVHDGVSLEVIEKTIGILEMGW
jgi:perosamine synthetase